MDQQFLSFTGIDPEALKQQVAAGKSDGEILEWIQSQIGNKLHPSQITAWSAYQEQRTPMDPEGRAFFQEEHQRIAPKREDIATWFDYLDLDDYVTYGGKA